jgi:hypothetical protein
MSQAGLEAVGRLETVLVILHESFEVGGIFAGEKQALATAGFRNQCEGGEQECAPHRIRVGTSVTLARS